MTTEHAYAEVQRLTRQRARNFAYGIMVLPREKRRAIAAIYAFARRVDDIADGDLEPATKRTQLLELRAALDGDTGGDDATFVALGVKVPTTPMVPAGSVTVAPPRLPLMVRSL